jgi:predicted porin
VSISNAWGELRLGQDFTPHYWNITLLDPFASVGVGATQLNPSSVGGLSRVRASNSIGYFLPRSLGGLYGQAMYYMGENLSNTINRDDGSGASFRLGYQTGPVNAAISYARTDYITGDIATTNLGASYDFGVLRLNAVWNRDEVERPGNVTSDGYMLGAIVPVGAGEFKVSVATVKSDTATSPRTRKLAVGYVYNLSKRTALYTAVARLRNSGGASQVLGLAPAAANVSSTGFDFGIRHTF